jgi:hypothetical protein
MLETRKTVGIKKQTVSLFNHHTLKMQGGIKLHEFSTLKIG